MAYKHIEIIGAYNVPGRGQVFLTLDRSTKPGEVIEVDGKTWKVTNVELSDVHPHAGLVVVPFTEADAKQATARDAKNLLSSIFGPIHEATNFSLDQPAVVVETALHNPITGLIPASPKPAAKVNLGNDADKLKLVQMLGELTAHMLTMRDWTLQQLSEFDLGKEPPSVLVMVVSMPRDGMTSYVQKLEPFLTQTLDALEKEGKLSWANVKAVAGVNNKVAT